MYSETAVESRAEGRGRRRERGNGTAAAGGPVFVDTSGRRSGRLRRIGLLVGYLPLESQWFMFGIGWVLIAVFIVVCGWVEDVAARKKPRPLP
jgi:hypothetical protein